ncbi:MAG: response regulator, partial [Bryobacterales bacterium]|nr:response regulator [Bryobacterales bacterium]
VADDNPHVHAIVRDTLGPDGHTITGAMTGPEALESISRDKPDIVLLDSTLSGLNALDACREALSLPSLENTRVVLLSGPLETVDDTEALQAGAWQVLQKPLDPEALAKLVDNDPDSSPGTGQGEAQAQLPAIDILVQKALRTENEKQLREEIREQVQNILALSIPSLVDRIADRLADKLRER